MTAKKFIIITTINQTTRAVKKIAEISDGWRVLIVADKKTPPDWSCPHTQLLSVADQFGFDSGYAQKCPWNHYARKNIGYLKAMQIGAHVIAETDDDNIPGENYLAFVKRDITGRLVKKRGWENVYTHFTDSKIWPRGFPLEFINQTFEGKSSLGEETVFECPIQQYLVDGDADTDAIFRLTNKPGTKFWTSSIILGDSTFCPFNAQNTLWWPEVFPLLYLPGFVSFRMTDIWRSFIAQVCLYKTRKYIAFGPATMTHDRSDHSIISDFKDEIPGYLNNVRIMKLLNSLQLSEKPCRIGENMSLCYEKLVEVGIIPQKELHLVNLWLEDVERFGRIQQWQKPNLVPL